MAERSGLYELLAPFFLAGFAVDRLDFLDELGVEEPRAASDDTAVVWFTRESRPSGEMPPP
jgi:hypothetical protein